ncbi:MAG: tripartite tricarboxylate transporter substrate binding protein [Burkholderiales bacterium]|nr:tripartite tricarboxylate transporter substrate binding protein [Burkholderiales bacterium]
MKIFRLFVLAVASLACVNIPARAAEFPSRPVELVAAGNPGGGLDLTARALEAALRDEKLFTQTLVIKNMGGAGGNLAKNYIHQKKGDPYFLYIESNRIFTNRIVGTTPLTYTDVTPIARLTTEYLVWAVQPDSPFKSAKDILAKIKADPGSVTFGVGTIPSNDQMNVLRAAMSQAIDPKQIRVVAFKAGGDLMIQLLGGHVPVISTGLSEAMEQARAGKVRLIAISSPEPIPGDFAKVPTWRSMGIDLTILHWRGVFAPPAIPAEVVKFWDQTLSKLVKTESWKKTLAKYQWFDAYAGSAEFSKSLAEESKHYEQILTQLGLAKSPKK